MKTRREFLKKTLTGGIAGIIASGVTPVFSKDIANKKKIYSIEEADEVHKRLLIIDGHNDTPVDGNFPFVWDKPNPQAAVDVQGMKEGGYNAGFFIVGDGPTSNVWVKMEKTLELIETHPDDLMNVFTSKDVLLAQKKKKIGVIMSVEGVGPWIDGNIDTLKVFHRLGIRLAGITHGEGGSEPKFLQGTKSAYRVCTKEERNEDYNNALGLTPFGKEVLKACNELGFVTDLSHINDKAFYDVLEYSSLPPIMSHTGVFSFNNHSRSMTDDMIKALASVKGVMGIVSPGIDNNPEKVSIDRFVEQICHVRDLVGIDYVGIATHYSGVNDKTLILSDTSKYVLLTQSMLNHGLSEEEIKKVWGGNFLRIMKGSIDHTLAKKK